MRRPALTLALGLLAHSPAAAMDAVYAAPQDALDALVAALGSNDPVSVAGALGAGAEDLTGALDDDIDAGALALLHAAWR